MSSRHLDSRTDRLDTSATSNLQSLTRDVRSQRTSKEQDRSSRLFSITWSSQRDISNSSNRLLLRVSTSRTTRNTKSDLLTINLDGGTSFLSLGQPSVDPTESDRVDTNTKGTPLLAHGLGETEHAGLCGRVVDLTDVTVSSGSRGDVDDGHIFTLVLVLDAEVRGSSTDDTEGGGDVAVEHELESGIVGGVSHFVGGETGIVDDDVELAPLVDGSFDYALTEVLVHDVAGERDGRSANFSDLRGDIVGLFGVEIGDNDVSTVAGEELGGGFTDTLTGASDDSDLTLEERSGWNIVHVNAKRKSQ